MIRKMDTNQEFQKGREQRAETKKHTSRYSRMCTFPTTSSMSSFCAVSSGTSASIPSFSTIIFGPLFCVFSFVLKWYCWSSVAQEYYLDTVCQSGVKRATACKRSLSRCCGHSHHRRSGRQHRRQKTGLPIMWQGIVNPYQTKQKKKTPPVSFIFATVGGRLGTQGVLLCARARRKSPPLMLLYFW